MRRALIVALPFLLLTSIGLHVLSRSSVAKRACFDFDSPRAQSIEDPAQGLPIEWTPFNGIGCETLQKPSDWSGRQPVKPEDYEQALSPQTPEEFECLACAQLRSYVLSVSSVTEEEIGLSLRPLNRALDLKSDYAEAYFTLGEVYVLLGREVDAASALDTCIHLRPNWANAYCLLRKAHKKAGNYNEAVRSYNAEIELRTRNSLTGETNGPSCCLLELLRDEAQHDYLDLCEMGDLHVANGNLQEAVKCYSSAVRICPTYEDTHLSLGEAYLGLGDKESARKEYDELVRICSSTKKGSGTQCKSPRVQNLLHGSE